MGKNNIFISWSGKRSLYAAEALREWLPNVIQAAKPWMSERDIEKGARGLTEVGNALEGMKVGIICLRRKISMRLGFFTKLAPYQRLSPMTKHGSALISWAAYSRKM